MLLCDGRLLRLERGEDAERLLAHRGDVEPLHLGRCGERDGRRARGGGRDGQEGHGIGLHERSEERLRRGYTWWSPGIMAQIIRAVLIRNII